MTEDAVSQLVIGAAIEVHRTLGGPGLLESVYEEALVHELVARDLSVQQQVSFPVVYKGIQLRSGLRLDLLVAERVIVECKATTAYNAVFESQVLTYLRILNLKLGMVINFGEQWVKNGVHRVVNGI